MSTQSPIPIDDALRARLHRVLELASGSLRRTASQWSPERPAPIWTERGRWYRQPEMWTDWTPGFFAGQMWILAKLLDDTEWRRRAEAHTLPLAHRRFDRDVHDLGFIFLSSWGRWLEVLEEGDPWRDRVIDTMVTAATVQSFRWNEQGEHGFIYSFNGPQSLFVDIMMNVRLLFWAHRHGASDEVLRRAVEHSRTSARFLVRQDGAGLGEVAGSVAHEAIFNTEPGRGEFRCLSTQQGWSPFTCWSRGLGWALYGFAVAHAETGTPAFLDAAERCAGYWLRAAPPTGIAPWDFGAPPGEDGSVQVDTSASAIVGCGLLELARLTESEESARAYRDAAVRIGRSLSSDEWLGPLHEGEEGVLLGGVYHLPRGWGVGGSVMWGDYFFLELVERLLAAR